MMVFMFKPIMNKMGYGITWGQATVLTYGGLRGAVSLSMALIIDRDEDLDEGI